MPRTLPTAGTTVRLEGQDAPVWGIVALVRNHAAHAAEMGASAPPDPVAFVKPPASVFRGRVLRLPQGRGSVEFEAELAVLLDRALRDADEATARRAVAGVGVCLDLTLRDEQAHLKSKAWPWLLSKGFDSAAPVSPFVRPPPGALGRIVVTLDVNGGRRQRFAAHEYVHPPERALSLLSHNLTLPAGTIVSLGSGPGVGPLMPGDDVRAWLEPAEGARLAFKVAAPGARSSK